MSEERERERERERRQKSKYFNASRDVCLWNYNAFKTSRNLSLIPLTQDDREESCLQSRNCLWTIRNVYLEEVEELKKH